MSTETIAYIGIASLVIAIIALCIAVGQYRSVSDASDIIEKYKHHK